MPGTMENQQTLESLLSDKDLRVDFIFYVNKIHAEESLLFWMEVEMFKRIVDGDECSKQAKLLYFRYLHPSSKSEINVEGKLKAEVEEIMATGIWDQTLYNAIQTSVHECLKFSVVRSFSDYLAKRKTQMESHSITPTHTMLERYDGMLQKNGKEYGTLRRPPKALRWIHKKTHGTIAGTERPKKEKAEKKGIPFFGKHTSKLRPAAGTVEPDPVWMDAAFEDEPEEPEGSSEDTGNVHRERLTQQSLQQQIQLLRNLHQYQHDRRGKKEAVEAHPWEFGSSGSSPLSKSVSMPVIAQLHLKNNTG